MNKRGFWLKESNVYNTLIIDIGFHSHIRYLMRNHRAFQISKDGIEKTYAKYNERPGFEGKAREELMKTAFSRGWVRIRHHLSPRDYWIIQCDVLAERKNSIDRFLQWGLENDVISVYQTVLMEDLGGERIEYDCLSVFYKDNSPIEFKNSVTVEIYG